MAEGIKTGEVKGEARSLLVLLQYKFGPVSEETRQRVCCASTEWIDHWIVRVLDARSLDEVFGDAGN